MNEMISEPLFELSIQRFLIHLSAWITAFIKPLIALKFAFMNKKKQLL